MQFYKLNSISKKLGVPYSRVYYLIRARKITQPCKDSSGDYVFLADDVEAIKNILEVKNGPVVKEQYN